MAVMGWIDQIDLGDAPTWLGAVFAAGAAWAAYMTLRSQQKQIGEQQEFIEKQQELLDEQLQNLRLERDELRAAARDRRRAQAVRIRIVCEKTCDDWDPARASMAYDRWQVTVRNNSDAPLYSMALKVGEKWQGVASHPFPPDEQVSWESEPFADEESVDRSRPVLYFTDVAGVRWRLDEHQHLTEVAQYTPQQ